MKGEEEKDGAERIGAAVDLGSNSCRLLIGRKREKQIVSLHRDREITRIAAGVNLQGEIDSAAQKRTMKALRNFRASMRKYGVEKAGAAGTSALRDAREGGRAFADKIEEKFDLPVQILSGREEAELVLAGVKSHPSREDVELVIDIGGGSTEMIWDLDRTGRKFISLDAGAVRFTEKFIEDAASTITASEIERIKIEVREELESFLETSLEIDPGILSADVSHVYGAGGTITTLAAAAEKMRDYRPEIVENYVLNFRHVEKMIYRLAGMKLKDRKKIPGLPEKRADIIVAGSVILLALMESLELDSLVVSDRGLLFGLLDRVLCSR